MTTEAARLPPNADEDDKKFISKCCYCSDPQVHLCDGNGPGGKCNRRLCGRHAQIVGSEQFCLSCRS